jgi:hypothetical protein
MSPHPHMENNKYFPIETNTLPVAIILAEGVR